MSSPKVVARRSVPVLRPHYLLFLRSACGGIGVWGVSSSCELFPLQKKTVNKRLTKSDVDGLLLVITAGILGTLSRDDTPCDSANHKEP